MLNGGVKALPAFGWYGFYEHSWSNKARSNISYGYLNVDNEDIQGVMSLRLAIFLSLIIFIKYQSLFRSAPSLCGEDKGENLRWKSPVIFNFKYLIYAPTTWL